MNTEPMPKSCPRCGSRIPAEAPQGLCPRCVLAGAAATEPESTLAGTLEVPPLDRVRAAFPQLEIQELIGHGGMGFVYKARQPHLDRLVALKILPDRLARDPLFAERFSREGRVLAKLNHPNIVSVFDFGQANGFCFLLMEFVDGVNLRQAMKAGRFSPAEALTIVPRICEALQYAHDQGILHRDIKPENILLDTRGRVKIADFGIAKLVGEAVESITLTGTGTTLGTPHYMAPEQLERPAEVDHRADIYSLGVVFYELLTGELPIGRFAAPSEKTPVDPRVDEVVFRTLAKERERRFQTAGELKQGVETVSGGGGRPGPSPAPAAQATPAPPPRWSGMAIASAALAGCALPLFLVTSYAALQHPGGVRTPLFWMVMAATGLMGLVGTILGWIAVSTLRDAKGALRGVPFAVFGALTFPLLALALPLVVLPAMMATRVSVSSPPVVQLVGGFGIWVIPAGMITFALWATHALTRWTAGAPTPRRRGVLKWIFLGLLASGVASGFRSHHRATRAAIEAQHARAQEKMQAEVAMRRERAPGIPDAVQITPTFVELVIEKGERWIVIHYTETKPDDLETSVTWKTTIPDFTPTVRYQSMSLESGGRSIQPRRIDFQLPPTLSDEQAEEARRAVEKAVTRRTFESAPQNPAAFVRLAIPGVGEISANLLAVEKKPTP